jgi:hypothetical protein
MGTAGNPLFRLGLAGVLLCLSFAGSVPAGAGDGELRQQRWVEPEVDRPGSDFKILWLRGGAEACQEACAQNPLCKSYTYVREGVRGRTEGCWLKDDVPPPVEDGCCVSGVKTPDAVSRFLRESAPGPGKAEPPQVARPEPTPVPDLSSGGPETREERVPETGSGKRFVAGVSMEATPPRNPGSAGVGIPVGHSPLAQDVGTGRREAYGVHYAAAPAKSRSIPGPVSMESPATGRGRREIRDVVYTASPSSGMPGAGKKDHTGTGTAVRKITGVDVTAIPPQR